MASLIEEMEKAGFKPIENNNSLVNAMAPTPIPKKSFLQKTTDVVSSIFPGKQIGETFGTAIATGIAGAKYGKEAAMEVASTAPTPMQVAGDIGQGALNVASGGIGSATKGLTTGARLLNVAKNVGKGASLGYGLDVTQKIKEGETDAKKALTPGLGTVTGAALPAGQAVIGATGRALGRGVSEVSGSLTGQGYGGQKALSEAIKQGGNSAKLARAAMRGGITDEQIFNEANEGLGSIINKRTNSYTTALSKISDDTKSYDTSPILKKLGEELDNFKVKLTKDGQLDFTQSPLRFDKKSQGEIQTIVDEMKEFGTRQGDRTAVGLDSLKRAFNDLYSDSSEARKFTSSMSKEVRTILKQVPGYDEMSSKYSKDTELIKSIQKDLSVNDRKSKDMALRKFSTILRNDTDARKQLLNELDQATGGKLIPMVAGNLAKPILPRGLTRPLSGLFAGGAGITGMGMTGVLKALIIGGATTSPRIAGEITSALDLPKKMVKPIAKALNTALLQFQVNKTINSNEDEQ